MKYTNPRLLLKVNEVDLYDLMLKTSRLLQETADDGVQELVDLLSLDVDVEWRPGMPTHNLTPSKTRDGLHRMLAYVFTMGVSFAVERQVEAGAAFLKHLEKQKES